MENNRNDLFDCLLQILAVFDSICKQNNLSYMLDGGSLLGAVRHEGFIPWDDDLDLAMPRSDYNKLIEMGNSVFKYPYFLQTPVTDPGYFKTFIRVRKSDTTFIPYKDSVYSMNQGVFVDIFPIDAVPDDNLVFRKQLKRIELQKWLLRFIARIDGKIGSEGLSLSKKIAYYLLVPIKKSGLLNSKTVFAKINSIASCSENIETKKMGLIIFSGGDKRNIWNREDITKLMDMKFEGRKIPGPVGFDNILTTTYGEYMTPVKQKSEHGNVVYDVNTPYLDYIESHKKELHDLWLSTR